VHFEWTLREKRGTNLAVGAIASIEEAAEAVVSVALGLARELGVRSTTILTPVRVSHDGRAVARYPEKVALIRGASLGCHSAIVDAVPIGCGGIRIAGRVGLTEDTDNRGGIDEDKLERYHDS